MPPPPAAPAFGGNIVPLGDGTYLVDGRLYSLQLDSSGKPTLQPATTHHTDGTASVPHSENQQATARPAYKPALRIVHRPAPTSSDNNPSTLAAVPVDVPVNGSVTEPPTLRLTSGRSTASSGRLNVSASRQRSNVSAADTATAEPGADGNDAEDGDEDLTIPASMKDIFDRPGKIYSLMYACWVRTTNILRSRPDIDLTGTDRWENDVSRADGVTAEIFDFLPEELRPLIMTDRLAGRAFRNRVRTQRTQAVYNAKFGFERAIENTYPQSVRKAYIDQRFDDPEIIALLKGKSESYHIQNPPLLYPPGKVGNVAYMYKNPLLTDLGKCMVFGRRALYNKRAHRSSTGVALGLKYTLPGFIAFVYQVARFLLTPDTKFAPTGDITGIHYFKDLEWHRERLMSKEAKGGKSAEVVQELYRFWDQNVFAFANPPAGAARRFPIDEDTQAELEWLHWGEDDVGETTKASEGDKGDTGGVGERENEKEDEEEGSQAVPDVIRGMRILGIDDELVEGVTPSTTTATRAVQHEEFARLSAALTAGFNDLSVHTTLNGKKVRIIPTVSALLPDCPEESAVLLSSHAQRRQVHEVNTEGLPALVDSSSSSEEDLSSPIDNHISSDIDDDAHILPPDDNHVSSEIHDDAHVSAVADNTPTLSLAPATGTSQPTVIAAPMPPRRKSSRTAASKKRK